MYITTMILLVLVNSWMINSSEVSRGESMAALITTLLVAMAWAGYLMDEPKAQASKEEEAKKANRIESWNTYFRRHDHLIHKWKHIAVDDKKRILFPELKNKDNALGREVANAIQLADILRPSLPDSELDVRDSPYGKAVKKLDVAIRDFQQAAREIGWRNLNETEREEAREALNRYYEVRDIQRKPSKPQPFSLVM